MQLNDILEAYSIRDISRKTNISENNLQNLLDMKFETLNKLKTMGFISILEREFNADLGDFKNISDDYYRQNKEEYHYALKGNIEEVKSKGNSKLLIVVILLIFGYASWYFFMQFDKKHLSSLNPFGDDDLTIENNISKVIDTNSSKVAVITVIEDKPKIDITTILNTPLVDINSSNINSDIKDDVPVKSNIKVIEKNETIIIIPKVEEPKVIVEKTNIVIIEPSRRLWFGIRNIKTKKRDQFSIAKPYKLDVSKKSWLVATSPASFYLIVNGKKTYYKGGKAQYLKITKDGVEKLTKREYVRKGGWKQW
ncbi:MAG: hypothetical protein QM493_05170 [Sulfurovum sp.]